MTRAVSYETIFNEHLTKSGEFFKKGGAYRASQSANGHSWAVVVSAEFNQRTHAEFIGEIYRLYERSRDGLIADGIATPTDAQIFTDMMSFLDGAPRIVRSDFSGVCR